MDGTMSRCPPLESTMLQGTGKRRFNRREEDRVHPFCLICGYDLYGTPSDRCPECGSPFYESEWRREITAKQEKIHEVAHTLEWLPMAWKTAAVGGAIRLTSLLPMIPSFAAWWCRLITVLCGVIAFFLGLNILRIHDLPVWARKRFALDSNYMAAVVSIVGGLALVVSVVMFG
jgi:ribosomal protein L37E